MTLGFMLSYKRQIIREKKKDIGEIEKIEKCIKKKLRVVYNSLSMGVFVLIIFAHYCCGCISHS